MEIDTILEAFSTLEGGYKRNEVDAALACREEITPRLIGILENVLSDPDRYAHHDTGYFAHMYAFMLLGHFSETKAHDAIVRLASLPGDLTDCILGESITEDLPVVLLKTCGGDTSRIRELAGNKSAYAFARGAAIRALSFALVEGYENRKELMAFLGELFDEDDEPLFNSLLAASVCDLCPEELMETVTDMYEKGLISSGHVTFREFGEAVEIGKEECLARITQNLNNRSLDNIHDRMSWWYCFEKSTENQHGKPSVGFGSATAYTPDVFRKAELRAGKAKSSKSKSKRKKARAARKANRKRKK